MSEWDTWIDEEFDLDEIPDETHNPARLYEANSAYDTVDKVMAKISVVVKLHAVDGHTIREISEMTGLKRSEVARCWKDGRSLLKGHL